MYTQATVQLVHIDNKKASTVKHTSKYKKKELKEPPYQMNLMETILDASHPTGIQACPLNHPNSSKIASRQEENPREVDAHYLPH